MSILEIVLLVGGALIFALGFIVPESVAGKDESGKKAEERVDRIIRDREDEIRNRIREIVDETREQAEEGTKRELERISNEKIMAVNDYSKVVMDDIEKNHKEVMFLYDMLDHKSADLKNTIRKADSVGREQKPAQAAYTAPVSSAPGSPARVSGMDRLRGKINPAPAKEEVPQPVKTEMQAEKLRKAAEEAQAVEVPAEKITSAAPAVVRSEEQKTEETVSVKKAAEDIFEAAPEIIEEPAVSPAVNRNEKVRSMHRDGASNVEIAKSLGMGVGEVNLIIDLYESDQEDLA